MKRLKEIKYCMITAGVLSLSVGAYGVNHYTQELNNIHNNGDIQIATILKDTVDKRESEVRPKDITKCLILEDRENPSCKRVDQLNESKQDLSEYLNSEQYTNTIKQKNKFETYKMMNFFLGFAGLSISTIGPLSVTLMYKKE